MELAKHVKGIVIVGFNRRRNPLAIRRNPLALANLCWWQLARGNCSKPNRIKLEELIPFPTNGVIYTRKNCWRVLQSLNLLEDTLKVKNGDEQNRSQSWLFCHSLVEYSASKFQGLSVKILILLSWRGPKFYIH